MKKYFILILIFICAITIVFSNCNKDTCLGKKHYYYISQTMKDYFGAYLQVGRKWVYENNSKTKETTLEILQVSEKGFFKEKCNYKEEYNINFSKNLLVNYNSMITLAKHDYSNESDDVFYSRDFQVYFSNKSGNFANCVTIDTITIMNTLQKNVIKYKSPANNTYFF